MPRPRLKIGERGKTTHQKMEDGTWKAKASYRDIKGVKRELTARAKSKSRAETALNDKWHRLSKQIINGRVGTESITLSAVFDQWFEHLERRSERTGKPTMRSIYDDRLVVNNHVLPRAGEWAMDQITVGMLNEMLWSIPGKDGSLMATARRAQTIMSRLCAYAVSHELLPFNMGRETDKIEYTSPPPKVVEPEELGAIREVFRAWCDHPTRWRTPILDILDLMLATGCRIGEVLALTWDKVHLEDDVAWVMIDSSTGYVPGKGMAIGPTKNRKSLRIALPDFAVTLLMRRMTSQIVESEYVFHTSAGNPYYLSQIERSVKWAMSPAPHLQHIWQGGFRSHSLRKTVLTAIEREHGLAAAAAQGGHSKEYITEKFYVAPNLATIDHTDAIGQLITMKSPVVATGE